MSAVSRLIVDLSVSVAVVATAMPATAVPAPRSDEWWFSAWGIQHDVWPVTRGAGVTVAVLDTGVNASLPELSGVVLKGGDVTGRGGDGRRDLDDRDGGHGTSMAALIAAQGRGSTGFVGIAPGARILPVYDAVKLGDPMGVYKAYAAGIRYAVDRGAKVINMSQGANSASLPGHCDATVQDAVSYAIEHDVIVVAAPGNSGTSSNWPDLPASCPGVLAVGAIDQSLHAWSQTQRQPFIAVSAPGVGPTIGKKGEYFRDSYGTSIAAALTSGAIALIRSRNPEMPAATVIQRLIATAHPLGSSKWNNQTGYGAIQITSAMNPDRYPVSTNAPNPVYDAFRKWRSAQSSATPSPGRNRPSRSASSSSKKNFTPIALAAIGGLIFIALVVGGIVWRRRTRPMAAGGQWENINREMKIE